jgi:hypothetical protein
VSRERERETDRQTDRDRERDTEEGAGYVKLNGRSEKVNQRDEKQD